MSPEPRTVLVIGQGGREYEIVRRLLTEKPDLHVMAAPGSTSWLPLGVHIFPEVSVTSFKELLVLAERADLTFIGPEQSLADDFFTTSLRYKKCKVFGPISGAARLETSKAFCANFLQKIKIPSPAFQVFTSPEACLEWLSTRDPHSIVIKADGLAAGKGVFLPDTMAEAEDIVDQLMVKEVLGSAGKTVVIQKRISGPELSVMLITDGKSTQTCPAVRDYKRLLAGNKGPNTGSMGALAPVESYDAENTIMGEHIIHQIGEAGHPYAGCLFLGLMERTAEATQVLETNCRFGDPEAITLMSLLTPESSFLSVINAVANGTLRDGPWLRWKSDKAVTVVLASAGYPSSSTKGMLIRGIERATETGAIVTHMGTSYDPNKREYRTNGGRVLAVTGLGPTVAEARSVAYAGVNKIHFKGMQYRDDIGL